jgi:ABC-type glycerol-3-phosphate transport system permease component
VNVYNKSHVLFDKYTEQLLEAADACNLELLAVDSNLAEVIEESYYRSHTMITVAAAYILSGRIGTFLYSSGFPFEWILSTTLINKEDIAWYDPFLLPLLTSENSEVLPSGTSASRISKLEKISNFAPTFRHLNVCQYPGKTPVNCGKCGKCTRTLLGLDALGVLEKYRTVFDVDAYKKNRWQHIVYAHLHPSPYVQEIIRYASGHGRPFMNGFVASVLRAAGRVLSTMTPASIRKMVAFMYRGPIR